MCVTVLNGRCFAISYEWKCNKEQHRRPKSPSIECDHTSKVYFILYELTFKRNKIFHIYFFIIIYAYAPNVSTLAVAIAIKRKKEKETDRESKGQIQNVCELQKLLRLWIYFTQNRWHHWNSITIHEVYNIMISFLLTHHGVSLLRLVLFNIAMNGNRNKNAHICRSTGIAHTHTLIHSYTHFSLMFYGIWMK